jgi:ribosomal protein S9
LLTGDVIRHLVRGEADLPANLIDQLEQVGGLVRGFRKEERKKREGREKREVIQTSATVAMAASE